MHPKRPFRPPRTTDLRLFVAIYPAPEAAAAMLAAGEKLDLPEHRPVSAERIHLTLLFIGDTPARDLKAVTESVSRAAAGLAAFELRPLRLVTLPAGQNPRLVAALTDAHPTLLEIRRRLVSRLASVSRRAGSFTPHFTLVRFTGQARLPPGWSLDTPVELPAFRVDSIRLVQSKLRASGAEHETVLTAQLEGSA